MKPWSLVGAALYASMLSIPIVGTAAAAPVETVRIDTTALAGTSGYLAFDLIGGSVIANNTISISAFASDATLGAVTLTGSASGSLQPGPAVLGDSNFFNELLQQVVFGNALTFDLGVSSQYGGAGFPDQFSFYLLDGTQNPYLTTDASGANSLFGITLDSASPTPAVYLSDFATATVTPQAPPTGVPEPASLWLLLA
ncbi:MAG: NF038129 family PEP-CTERM protein, partial [Burkholderiales bacterium]|nr:NF038129 family PEP-CTERM protein [Burkholderiales bacterium]